MENFLPAILIAIDDEAVAARRNAFLLGYVPCHQQHTPDKFGVRIINIIDRGDSLIRHDEDVNGCQWVYIAKSGDPIVAIDDIGGDFPGNDARKKSSARSHVHPSIHIQRLSGDVFRLIRRQESNCCRDFARLSHTPERDVRARRFQGDPQAIRPSYP